MQHHDLVFDLGTTHQHQKADALNTRPRSGQSSCSWFGRTPTRTRKSPARRWWPRPGVKQDENGVSPPPSPGQSRPAQPRPTPPSPPAQPRDPNLEGSLVDSAANRRPPTRRNRDRGIGGVECVLRPGSSLLFVGHYPPLQEFRSLTTTDTAIDFRRAAVAAVTQLGVLAAGGREGACGRITAPPGADGDLRPERGSVELIRGGLPVPTPGTSTWPPIPRCAAPLV